MYLAPESVELETEDEKTNDFIDKIGKSIKIDNETDLEIINHLIEDIKKYQHDQQKLFSCISNLTDENTQLQSQVLTLKQENHVLENQAKLHKQELEDQKEDFIEAARSLSIQSLENKNILDADDMSHLKDTVQQKTMEHFKATIDKHIQV